MRTFRFSRKCLGIPYAAFLFVFVAAPLVNYWHRGKKSDNVPAARSEKTDPAAIGGGK